MFASMRTNTEMAQKDRLFDVLTHSVPGFVWLSDPNGNVEFVNDAWCEYTGLTSTVSLGKGWAQMVHPDDLAALGAIWPPRASGRNPAYQIQLRFRHKSGQYRWHMVRANPVADSDGQWIGCSTDIHDLVAMQTRDRAQAEILNRVAAGDDVEAILEELCALGEEQLPDSRCTVILLNDGGTEFTGGAAPFLPDAVRSLIHGTKVGTGVGSCGTAAFEKRDVVSECIETDPLWDGWREAFTPLGIKACWSLPVYGPDGDVLATFGFYFYAERAPREDELKSLDNLRRLASVAIDKARTAQALRESEEHYRHTVEHNPQIPWTADPHGRILSLSSRWKEATGLPVESAIGHGWFQALHPEDVDRVRGYWAERLQTGEPADLKYRIRLEDHTYRWVRARATPRRDENGQIVKWYGAVEDIHDLELATERLHRQAYVDDLTRLANRRSVEEELTSLLQEAQNCGDVELLVVDLCGFRHLNDRFGHETGDAVLRLFAILLRKCLSETDVIGRIAGDQFVVMLHVPIGEAGLQPYAVKLARELEHRMDRNTRTRNVGVRIGCARSLVGDRCDDLIRRAKMALYAAKEDSKQPARLFTPALQRTIDERADQLELARQALRSRWLVPYYQPMIDFRSGKVAGAEALLRVDHPADGILSPASIWAALDAPKLSKLINDQMMALVLSDLREWGPWPASVGSISINLSSEMLMQEGLARSLLRKLERKSVKPHQLTVEITERVLVDELAPKTRQCLEQLQRHGVRVSLDDFGTGFASLTHLQRLPVSEIKIDRSFVSDLGQRGTGTAIVKSMIHLALNMGIDVVAEGVETAEQAQLLQEWGCRYAQGYYFSKPLPADEFGAIWCAVTKPDRRTFKQKRLLPMRSDGVAVPHS